MKLSDQTERRIAALGKRKLVRNGIKSLLFWGVTMTALFVTGSRSKLFNMREQPVWFWGVFVILLAAPILYFRLYQLVTCPAFTGTVSKLTNKTHFGGKSQDVKGFVDNMNSSELGRYEVCNVTALDGKGRPHVFQFPRSEKTAFAWEYYQVGDVVSYPRFAKYPFNESRLPSHPFCLCCGYIGAAGERECPDCGVPFVPDHMEETEKTEEQDT